MGHQATAGTAVLLSPDSGRQRRCCPPLSLAVANIGKTGQRFRSTAIAHRPSPNVPRDSGRQRWDSSRLLARHPNPNPTRDRRLTMALHRCAARQVKTRFIHISGHESGHRGTPASLPPGEDRPWCVPVGPALTRPQSTTFRPSQSPSRRPRESGPPSAMVTARTARDGRSR